MKKRWIAAAVAVFVATCVLAGCSTTVPVKLGAPAVSSCWEATRGDGVVWADWQGAPPVKCSTAHDYYTFGVGQIKGVTSSTWTVSRVNPSLKPPVALKAASLCSALATRVLHTKWNQQLLILFNFIPTPAEWKAGARWVRCDVAEAAYGTPIGGENIVNLPQHISTLIAENKADPLRFASCLNDPGLIGGLEPVDDPSAIVADCRTKPEWMLAAHGSFSQPVGATFPSVSVVSSTLQRICGGLASASTQVVSYAPTSREWAYGYRVVTCWIGVPAKS